MAAGLTCVVLAACGGESADRPDGNTPAGDAETASAANESTTGSPGGATDRAGAIRVLFIGTSLTAGMGLDPDSAYPAVIGRLADEAGYEIAVNAQGLSGETSAGALRRVDWLLSRERPEVVVLETGANDGLRGLRPDSTQANIVGIIRRVRAANPQAKVLLAQMEAPPNLGARYTREFHDLFMNVAREQQVILIPFFLEGVAGEPALNQGDGIHPNEEGARRAAGNMWNVLGPVLQQVPGAFRR
jgi:acyl-CoA thioesterase-1